MASYGIHSGQVEITPIGNGNINDTYLVRSIARPTFILQRINGAVFPKPQVVVENFVIVTRHLQEKVTDQKQDFLFALPIATEKGLLWLQDDRGNYWRGQQYLANSICHSLRDRNQAGSVGSVLASFHLLLQSLAPTCLGNPLPGFHNLSGYLETFLKSWKTFAKPVSDNLAKTVDAVERFREMVEPLEKAKQQGILTLQPVHGDPKLDNFIFDESGVARGLLDLDTIGPGLLLHDVGDCLRSCCNIAGEQAAVPTLPEFDLKRCQWILEGYFEVPENTMRPEEASYIFDAVLGITFELGVRFLTDHLQGDKYFKVNKSGDNLDKAEIQFALVDDILAKRGAMKKIIDQFSH